MEHHDKSMERICHALSVITEAFDCEVYDGISDVDTKEAGKVADIIKDLTEAKENLCKARYYHDIAEAMEDSKEDDDSHEHRDSHHDDRYGKPYHEYLRSRQHYMDTKSPADKDAMEMHANEYMSDIMTSIKEINRTADPEMRKQIKLNLTKFVSELPA